MKTETGQTKTDKEASQLELQKKKSRKNYTCCKITQELTTRGLLNKSAL